MFNNSFKFTMFGFLAVFFLFHILITGKYMI